MPTNCSIDEYYSGTRPFVTRSALNHDLELEGQRGWFFLSGLSGRGKDYNVYETQFVNNLVAANIMYLLDTRVEILWSISFNFSFPEWLFWSKLITRHFKVYVTGFVVLTLRWKKKASCNFFSNSADVTFNCKCIEIEKSSHSNITGKVSAPYWT